MRCATFFTRLTLTYGVLHYFVPGTRGTKIGVAECSIGVFIPKSTCSIYCKDKGIAQIESVFDNITQSISQECGSLTLALTDVKFPKRRISKNWWSGGMGQRIDGLSFVRSQFEVIEEDAFTAKSFENLSELIFYQIKSIKCLAGWNRGLSFLDHLQFFESNLVDVGYDFLQFSMVSELIAVSSLKNTKLLDLFGNEFITFLFRVIVQRASSMTRITIADLTRLDWIEELALIECGIETIADGVFTNLRRLQELDLSGNNLKTLSATMFDGLFERRTLMSLSLDNNKRECYCDLIELNVALRSYGINFEDFPRNCELNGESDQALNSSQPQCKATLDNVVENTCQKEYGFNSIFVTYPKVKVHVDELMENLLISYPLEHDEYFVIQMPHDKSKLKYENRKSVICRVLSYQKTNSSVTHSEGKVITICFLETKLKHPEWEGFLQEIWPLNCVSFCKGCDNLVWFSMGSLSLAIGMAAIFVIFTLLMGMGIGFLMMWIHPRFLIGAKRIVVLQNRSKLRQSSITIFVMPEDWTDPRQDREITGAYKSPADDYWQDLEEINEYIDIPPLPPRANRKPNASVFVI